MGNDEVLTKVKEYINEEKGKKRLKIIDTFRSARSNEQVWNWRVSGVREMPIDRIAYYENILSGEYPCRIAYFLRIVSKPKLLAGFPRMTVDYDCFFLPLSFLPTSLSLFLDVSHSILLFTSTFIFFLKSFNLFFKRQSFFLCYRDQFGVVLHFSISLIHFQFL